MMLQPHPFQTNRPRARGFAAVMALFVVVILAALGAYMVSFSSVQQVSAGQDVQGSRAYWAARAGLEWAISGVVASAACPTPAPTSIEGFSMTISCTVTNYTEGGATRKIFQLVSVASAGGSVGNVGYIERSVSAAVEQ